MSATPKRGGNGVPKDHEHVGSISTSTTIVVLIALALLLYQIQWVLPPFVISGLVAYLCTPLVEWAAARTGLPRWLFATVAFVLLTLIAAGIAYLGVPPLARELTRVLTDFRSIIQVLAQGVIGSGKISLLGEPLDATQLAQAATTGVTDWIGHVGTVAVVGSIVFGTTFGLILTLVLLLYFLLSGPGIARGLLWLVPPRQRPLIERIWSFLDPVLRRYFIGVLAVVAYAAAAAYVGLGLVLHIPHAVFLALLTGVLEMIPVVGPAASALIAGMVAVHQATGIGPILAYALYATALRVSIDQVFGPLALGTAARLHPVLVIFCFLSGGVLFGVVGVIMSVPVALVVKVTLAMLYDEPLTVA